MSPWRGWCAFGAAFLVALHASWAAADPQVGWWWNSDESGRGYFIESQGGTFIPFQTWLRVTNMAEYGIQIGMLQSGLPDDITVKCTTIIGTVSTTSFDPGAYIQIVNSGVVSGTSPHSFVSGGVGPVSIGPDTEREGRYGPFFEVQ